MGTSCRTLSISLFSSLSEVSAWLPCKRPLLSADAANGAFVFLGIGDAELGTDQLLHTPHFQMDESMLPVGAALHANVAFKLLQHFGHRDMGQRPASDEL